MAHEFQESFNAPAECSQSMCSLGDFVLVRPHAQRAQQDSNGVKKATAIRDGKSFQEFDPNSPLGDMRSPELPRKK